MRKESLIRKYNRRWGLFFVFPSIVFYSIFMIYPTFNAFWISLFKYDLLSSKIFIGLSNYKKIFSDYSFYESLLITFIYAISTTILIMFLALFFAILLNKAIIGRTVYRAILYMPSVMSMVAVAIIFSGFFNSKGLANHYISIFYPGTRISWLSSYPHALVSIIITRVWRAFGYFMVIYLAGLQNIPYEYYEAGEIDGINWLDKFKHITWPLLKPTTAVVSLMAIVNSFQSFTEPYILTGGGPAGKTRILPIMLYDVGFRFFRMGEASAISVVIFIIIGIFSITQFRMSKKVYS